jgi:23S rRNA pseudouridine1911/1915/1917 synthase
MTLMDWLILNYPAAKRQTLRRMVEEGRVAINGQAARSLKTALGERDQVKVHSHEQRPQASISPLKIIHEDHDILVVLKPAGLLTSTVAREKRQTAIAIIRSYLAEREPAARAGVIHRLDKDASGLLVFSKNNQAYESLKRQFFEHSVERVYLAIVFGRPSQKVGRIKSRLVELTDGSMVSTNNPEKGQLAITEYELLESHGDVSALRVTLKTGRKHQIRAHLSQRGFPIVGDEVYGKRSEKGKPKSGLMLSAVRLAITHPTTGQKMEIEVPPPRSFAEFTAEMRRHGGKSDE